MKILRSVTRRGFSFGTAGYFTVLKPNTWFPASRLQASAHSRSTERIALSGAGQPADTSLRPPPPAPALRIPSLAHNDNGLLRPLLIVLAAAAITCILLWWIMGSAPPNHW